MKLLFLFPYPTGQAASQRFRFEQYFDILQNEGIEYDLAPFLSERAWKIFYKKGRYLRKFMALLSGFLRRTFQLFSIGKYDFIFIHRESFPIGPPVYEFILSKVLGMKIIYDFDDAIWIENSSESNRFFSPLKTHSNVFTICKWAYKVSVGNDYLRLSVKPYNSNVVINPTTIDTNYHHNIISDHDGGDMVIGWTGSHSTLKYLDLIFDVVRQLKKKHNFRFIIISDQPPESNTDLFEFVKWKKDSEINDLIKINIGLMPLSHDPWSEGKCGFKALQYMSLGIPALVSPVGVNEKIVEHGRNGYVCRNDQEWYDFIEKLLEDKDLIRSMGKEARVKVENDFSVASNTSNFIHLFT